MLNFCPMKPDWLLKPKRPAAASITLLQTRRREDEDEDEAASGVVTMHLLDEDVVDQEVAVKVEKERCARSVVKSITLPRIAGTALIGTSTLKTPALNELLMRPPPRTALTPTGTLILEPQIMSPPTSTS